MANQTAGFCRSGENRLSSKLRVLTQSPDRVKELDIRLAQNIDEMEAAFRLIHDNYVSYGYMEPLESGCRISRYNLFPSSYTLVASGNGKTGGTLTVVTDTGSGLPMDELYTRELDKLRTRGRKTGEISGLACTGGRSGGYSILVEIFKYAYILSRDVLGLTDFCITVNPRHRKYYERMLLFECLGQTLPCPRVGGAPAVPLRLDLTSIEERQRKVHPQVAEYFLKGREGIRIRLQQEITRRKRLFTDSYRNRLRNLQPEIFESMDRRLAVSGCYI